MFCPKCTHANPPGAETCAECKCDFKYWLKRMYGGRQFVFIQADDEHPVALKVDDDVQTFHGPTILSRHRHTLSFGEGAAEAKDVVRNPTIASENGEEFRAWPLQDMPRLPNPSLRLLTVVTDRKIYQPGTDATLFIAAPDAAESEASLEVRLAGNKVYEAKVSLNREGLALHHYVDLEEGEYTAVVTLPALDDAQAQSTFSVAEYSLSPLIAILKEHEYADRQLSLTLELLRISVPYSGPVEFGLQCQVCDGRVVATQSVEARDGLATGSFDLSGHGGPFHVQVTTPDGDTALVAFPGTGATERAHVTINPLGQMAEMGLLPWEGARPVRGFYVGGGEVSATPLMLESVYTASGRLNVASDIEMAQVLIFDPRAGTSRVIEKTDLKRGEVIEFEVDAPYTLFTVGAFVRGKKESIFEGWGVVISPVGFEATLTTPKTSQPGEMVDIDIEILPSQSGGSTGAVCWLLVYDARLEHESPLPKLAKHVYESIHSATGALGVGPVDGIDSLVVFQPIIRRFRATMAADREMSLVRGPAKMMADTDAMFGAFRRVAALGAVPASAPVPFDVAVETPVLVMTPARMEFPELVHSELFYMEGRASRTVKLGDQIGTWRVRAYVFKGVDCRELTSDVQAEKPVYAELDLPATASPGDDIVAAVNYNTLERADLVIATPFGETRAQVSGSGTEQFPIKGPGRVEVRIEGQSSSDWTVRDVAPPGVQKVTASRLVLLDEGQSVQGEQVVAYASTGYMLKDTITALIGYPFG